MTRQLLRDSAERPAAFKWSGAIDRGVLHAWIERGHVVPADLAEIWLTLGGGDLFETEELLAPKSGDRWDIEGGNEVLRREGLPVGLLAIHTGTWVTAVDQKTRQFVVLDRGRGNYARSSGEPVHGREIARYSSLGDWYVNTLRVEFAERYGLSAADNGLNG